jgi:hypothetical protein
MGVVAPSVLAPLAWRAARRAMNQRLLWEGVFSGSAAQDCGVADSLGFLAC